MKAKLIWILLAIIIIVSLTGCSKTQGGATPTPDGPAVSFNPVVNATGVVVPSQWAALSAQTSGVVSDVLVADGDNVINGRIIDPTEVVLNQRKPGSLHRKWKWRMHKEHYDNLVKDSAALAAQSQSDIVKANDMIIAAERALDDFEKNTYLDDVKNGKKECCPGKNPTWISAQKNFDKYASEPLTDSNRSITQLNLRISSVIMMKLLRDLLELEMKKDRLKRIWLQEKLYWFLPSGITTREKTVHLQLICW